MSRNAIKGLSQEVSVGRRRECVVRLSGAFALVLVLIFGFLYPMSASAQTHKLRVIRLAILDTPLATPSNVWTLSQYEEAYVNGIKVAVKEARAMGYAIQYKLFIFDRGSLSVFNKIRAVKAWHPDVIIGPHYSNQFLLLRGQFKHVMVLSPYASDPAIRTMGKNYYTLSIMDNDYVRFLVAFIRRELHVRMVFNIVNAACKDCVDFTRLITRAFHFAGSRVVSKSVFFVRPISDAEFKRLFKGYHGKSVIDLQLSNYYNTQVFVKKITQLLKGGNPQFLTLLDQMGPPSFTVSGGSQYRTEYRVYNALFDKQSELFNQFSQAYTALFNQAPSAQISYITYLTVRSFLVALIHYPVKATSMRSHIEKSYILALKHHPYWFKTHTFFVDQVAGGHLKHIYRINLTPKAVFIRKVDAN